jgi:hypothetical protein
MMKHLVFNAENFKLCAKSNEEPLRVLIGEDFKI